MKYGMWVAVAGLLAGGLLAGPCRSAANAADTPTDEAAAGRADAALAAAAGALNADAWLAFYAPDAIVRLPRDRVVSGAPGVRAALERLLARHIAGIEWHPSRIELAQSGDLAYVTGRYDLQLAGARAAPESDRGTRTEIWRRQADGTWKCIVDVWDALPAAAPALPALAPAASSGGAQAPSAPPEPPAAARAWDAKYGQVPVNYRDTIREYFQDHLKDPDSVQYRQITAPEKGYATAITGAVLMRETHLYGWAVKATIDAKDARGRYVGFKTYTFLFRGEKIVNVAAPLPDGEMN